MNSLIVYRCANPRHFAASDPKGNHLTIYEKHWSYCPADTGLVEHEWVETTGISLTEVERIYRPVAHEARPA